MQQISITGPLYSTGGVPLLFFFHIPLKKKNMSGVADPNVLYFIVVFLYLILKYFVSNFCFIIQFIIFIFIYGRIELRKLSIHYQVILNHRYPDCKNLKLGNEWKNKKTKLDNKKKITKMKSLCGIFLWRICRRIVFLRVCSSSCCTRTWDCSSSVIGETARQHSRPMLPL